MAVKDQLIIKDAVTKWINQWIKRELRAARGTGRKRRWKNEGDELDGDSRTGVARPWRLSFVTQITEHLAGNVHPAASARWTNSTEDDEFLWDRGPHV